MNEATLPDFAQLAREQVPLVIAGTTASGKSQLAIQLALEFGGEIVNLDPFQALEQLPILTAQPSAADLAVVAHHLYGIYSLEAQLNAAEFAQTAHAQVVQLQQRNCWPILVTGSGLYLRAFSHGLSSTLPTTPDALRKELSHRSLAENLSELESLDPVEASRIDQQNPRRVERALALCRLLGEPISQHRTAQLSWEEQPKHKLTGLMLTWEREELWQRIQKRSEQMFSSEAFAKELCALEQAQLGPSASRVIGLREAREWLGGALSTAQAVEKLSIRTRQYAKRQRTWFSKEAWLLPLAAKQILKN